MFSEGIFALLVQVVSSWQVIAVTIALILYLKIVFYTAQSYHRPRTSKKAGLNKKKGKSAANLGGPEETPSGKSSNDELGLEEE